jgi:hypothetical protein
MSDATISLARPAATVLHFPRTRLVPPSGQPRQEAIARLREALPRDSVVYAVRRAHDAEFGWIVCDFYRIDGTDVTCISKDVALALECYDPAREVGVKLRRSQGVDPLAPIIAGRLSTVLFGRPNALRHCMIG